MLVLSDIKIVLSVIIMSVNGFIRFFYAPVLVTWKKRGQGMELKRLGLRIRELRRKKKFTQDELSELAGMNGKHLGEVERGIINISIQNLDKIAESLGVPLLELLDVEHQKPKDELCREIVKILDESGYEQVQLIHRVVKDIIS